MYPNKREPIFLFQLTTRSSLQIFFLFFFARGGVGGERIDRVQAVLWDKKVSSHTNPPNENNKLILISKYYCERRFLTFLRSHCTVT